MCICVYDTSTSEYIHDNKTSHDVDLLTRLNLFSVISFFVISIFLLRNRKSNEHFSYFSDLVSSSPLIVIVDPISIRRGNFSEREFANSESIDGWMDGWMNGYPSKERDRSTAIGGPVVIRNPRDASVPGFIAI